ncbi:MAG: hypothetical protein Q9194_005872 [Teloschistes cf. exilis]
MDNPKAQSSERRENKGPSFLATALVFTIIALVFVSLRLRVRTWVEHSAGWDDGMIVFSTVSVIPRVGLTCSWLQILAIVSTAFNIPEVQAGYGRHQATLSEIALIESLKWNYLATPLLVLSIAASKISICLMLLRILEKTKAIFRRSLPYGMMVLLTANATSAAGYALGQCQPVRKLWNHAVSGHCQNPQIFVNFGYANGSQLNQRFCRLRLGAVPAVLHQGSASATPQKDHPRPAHVLRNHVTSPGPKKLADLYFHSDSSSCGVLAITRTILTGDLTAQSDITCTYRAVQFSSLKHPYPSLTSSSSLSATDDSVDSSVFALVEENVSIIVACVPTLGPFYQSCYERTKNLHSRRKGNRSSLQDTVRQDKILPLNDMLKKPRHGSCAACGDQAEGKRGVGMYGSQTYLVAEGGGDSRLEGGKDGVGWGRGRVEV